ncbi:MAG: hypothetical protein H6733_11435 [Alphaproteobacteria bacterium]|nr:hypothetical protein [Alphaproteobacteria bacterium]
MRWSSLALLTTLSLTTVGGCNLGGDPPASAKELKALDKRVAALEKSVQAMEKERAHAAKADAAREHKSEPAKSSSASKGGKTASKSGKDAKSGGKGGKADAKGGKGGKGDDDRPSASVAVTGDASAVVLVRQRKRYPVPGTVPAGPFSVLATFDGAEVEAGTIRVATGATTTVVCTASTTTCTAE